MFKKYFFVRPTVKFVHNCAATLALILITRKLKNLTGHKREPR